MSLLSRSGRRYLALLVCGADSGGPGPSNSSAPYVSSWSLGNADYDQIDANKSLPN